MFRSRNQVVLPLEIEKIIPKDDPVFKLAEICDKLDYSYTSKYTTDNGYVTSRKVYQCESCEGCPYRNECHTSKYVKLTGMIAKIDYSYRVLRIVDIRIHFDDIIDIEYH